MTVITLLTCASLIGRKTIGARRRRLRADRLATGAAIALFMPCASCGAATSSSTSLPPKPASATNLALDRFGALLLACCFALLAWRAALGGLNSSTQLQHHDVASPNSVYAPMVPGFALTAVIGLWQASAGFAHHVEATHERLPSSLIIRHHAGADGRARAHRHRMFVVGLDRLVMQTGWASYANFLNSMAFARFASYDLSVIPLFILMGQFATQGGISKALFAFTAAVMGRSRAGWRWRRCWPAPPSAPSAAPRSRPPRRSRVALPEMKRHGYSGRLRPARWRRGHSGHPDPASVPLVIYAS